MECFLYFSPTEHRSEHTTLAEVLRLPLYGVMRTGGDRGRFEYATASIEVNDGAVTPILQKPTQRPPPMRRCKKAIDGATPASQRASGAMTPFLNTKQP
jgi:hypothetical protein